VKIDAGKLTRVTCISPSGFQVQVYSTGTDGLWLDRTFIAEKGVVDIRSFDMPKHREGSRDRVVATVPASWALVLAWEFPSTFASGAQDPAQR